MLDSQIYLYIFVGIIVLGSLFPVYYFRDKTTLWENLSKMGQYLQGVAALVIVIITLLEGKNILDEIKKLNTTMNESKQSLDTSVSEVNTAVSKVRIAVQEIQSIVEDNQKKIKDLGDRIVELKIPSLDEKLSKVEKKSAIQEALSNYNQEKDPYVSFHGDATFFDKFSKLGNSPADLEEKKRLLRPAVKVNQRRLRKQGVTDYELQVEPKKDGSVSLELFGK